MFSGWLDRHAHAADRRVRLTLPEPHAGCHPHALVRPTEFKAWLAELPTANPLITSEKIAYQLGLLARYPRRINRLRTILALIQAPIADLAEHTNDQLREQAVAAEMALLNPLVRTFITANHEFAQVQKRYINELLEDGKTPPATLLIRTMASLAQEIRLNLTAYSGTPPGPWRDMLRLYTLAGALDLRSDEQTGIGARALPTENPHHLLVGSLLYQLTDPLHLQAGQGLDLFDYAISLAPQVRLTLEADGTHLIVVDRSGSLPPMTAARGVESPDPQDLGYLDVADLIAHLAALPDPEIKDSLMLATLRDLSAEFSDRHGRRHPRIPRQAHYAMFVGISAIHQRLSHLTRDESKSPAGEPSLFSAAQTPSVKRPPSGIACEQVNYSEGGAAFELPTQHFRHGQVGDLVLFESRNEAAQQRLTGLVARICRLLRRDASTLEIGVEKVVARLSPVKIKGHRGSGHALIYPGSDEAGWQLFAPADAAHPGAILELQSAQGAVQVRIEKELDRTPSMVHAQVSRIG